MRKRELIGLTETILSTKDFSPEAKIYLADSLLQIYDNYSPPIYIPTTKDEYISKYLEVLNYIRVFEIYSIKDFNKDNDVAEFFRRHIKKSQGNNGTIALVNGEFIETKNGEYKCLCNGAANSSNKEIYTLENFDSNMRTSTIIHEMTHLQEGIAPFLVKSSIPYSYQFRLMCRDGRAAMNESFLNLNRSNIYYDTLEDGEKEYTIKSSISYPLYSFLYKVLVLLFGYETMEQYAKNNYYELDMLEDLKRKFPHINVEEVYANIIYILSTVPGESKLNYTEFETSLKNYLASLGVNAANDTLLPIIECTFYINPSLEKSLNYLFNLLLSERTTFTSKFKNALRNPKKSWSQVTGEELSLISNMMLQIEEMPLPSITR